MTAEMLYDVTSSEDDAVLTPGSDFGAAARHRSASPISSTPPANYLLSPMSRDDADVNYRLGGASTGTSKNEAFLRHREKIENRKRVVEHREQTLERERAAVGMMLSPGKRKKASRRGGNVHFAETPSPRGERSGTPSAAETFNVAMYAVFKHMGGLLRYLTELTAGAAVILKTPIMFALAVYVVIWTLGHSYTYTVGVMHKSLQPFCKIPGISVIDLPFCQPLKKKTVPDYPQLIELQSNFEKVLENSVGGSSLALDMKQSEVVIRDLATLVKMSSLSCRDTLYDHLDSFSKSAKQASRELQKLGSRVGGAVDQILAMDEWALRRLQEVHDREHSIPRSIVATFNPWPGDGGMYDKLIGPFLKTSTNLEHQLARLILEAEMALNTLNDLENRLDTIYEVVNREEQYVRSEKNEVEAGDPLVRLFTLLGANSKKREQFSRHIKLLGDIAFYRNKALAHVTLTLVQLQGMSEDLEDLRERVAAPALLADVHEIPLEIHIESIQKGIQRLTMAKLKGQAREAEKYKMVLAEHDRAAPVQTTLASIAGY